MTALPSTEDLARLAKAITPGPWRRNLENTVCNQIDGEHHAICTDQFCYAPEEQHDANAEAIALLPALIREVLDRREAEDWRDISTAPEGCITEDVGCRGPSEWFLGKVSTEFRAGRPPFIVVRRRAWPQEDSWECAGEAFYVPRFFSAWRPLPAPPSTPTTEARHGA